MSASRPVILAAGGTGGHVFPAESLAGELARRGVPLALITDDRGHKWQGALAALPAHRVRAGSPGAGGIANRIGNVAALGVGVLQSFALLGGLAPAAVVGFGGYASVPAMLAARLRRLPTLVHEQNAVLGRANRLVVGRRTMIATAFGTVRHLAAGDPRVRLVGNPVRDAVRALRDAPYQAPTPDGEIRMVVIGGSQGAASFGIVIPEAIAALPEALRRRLQLVQQCRAEDLARVRAFYTERGIDAECATFFSDFPARLAGAHLVVARAGASTVAELTTSGRPSVLVPFPHATEDHQRANAKAIDEVGASILLPHERFTAEALRAHLETLFGAPDRLAAMAAAARAAGRPDAARDLADLVVDLIARQSSAAHPYLPPEGEGAPKGRKGDARSESISSGDVESIPTSPFRRSAPPSPSGGRKETGAAA
ncbi:undecaprenyldiphospho-muramoylpentapeptide beta-N-acetylglucosaminyltransferase [Vineibacter terrae]|uniref:UDP-N-acetylglucosamine--N-acetylmuramyl-(pentapeptide) pyrophosphoryl-undecaprenol N-acetylglucosamine transferase n=1 Tax=Vineibacter terrae TaxID=2586908 RepID=A0A5C8PIC6_9HYPH|nr:undecaprenyldiphospho-muramoylpentapeptide beta-N-acetylglucosaminyltransferase [Vineibacter terrae]TXL73557.1 undecaprenyldiphospho-muramoylpentapeptide beta-N-acetylglucosaminyltransferase [Vineibacter terrae]